MRANAPPHAVLAQKSQLWLEVQAANDGPASSRKMSWPSFLAQNILVKAPGGLEW